MSFDIFSILDRVEETSPKVSRFVGIKVLNWMSPFNSHLRAKILKWSKEGTTIQIHNHRAVRNHIGGIHAGALFTLGETCAGLTLIKNFSFSEYRPILVNVSVQFEKQARHQVLGSAELSPALVKRLKKGLEQGTPQLVPLQTKITNEKEELLALVKTEWQIKSWKQVRTK